MEEQALFQQLEETNRVNRKRKIASTFSKPSDMR